ncbi:MAG: CatA-like O-acetyltransferase [Marinicellaceae bacterium]
MKYQHLNLKTWPRLKQYQFFKKYENPFFNICTTLDVTQLVEKVNKEGYSFSTSLLFASIHTANQMDEFKYRLKDDGVIVCDSIYAGSTILNDDETFSFCYFNYFSEFKHFHQNAHNQIKLSKQGRLDFDARNNDIDIIHYSIIPWISFTSFSHPRNYATNDSIPKIVFGKYYPENNRIKIPISIEVHHALMDGYHMGKYLETLQTILNHCDFLNA